MNRLAILVVSATLFSSFARGQNAPSANAQQVATYAGCLTPRAGDEHAFVLASGDRCYYITDPAAAVGAGHEIAFKAVLVPGHGAQPVSLGLKSAVDVKAACTRTCVLQPPGTRGLGPKDKPGPEGATQGITGTPQPQP